MFAKRVDQEDRVPEDILVGLLSRLPAKSIGRFRCASKAWKSLLSQPYFTKTHLKRIKHIQIEQESAIILVCRDSGSLYSVQIKNAQHQVNEITISATKLTFGNHRFRSSSSSSSIQMGSCDGLVIIKDEEDKLVLINPTTREFKELPSSLDVVRPLRWGIGYDSISDDYKVIVISYYGSDDMMFVNIYSVRNDSWKRVENCPFRHEVGDSLVFVDGYMYWLVDTEETIAAFDLEEEEFNDLTLSGYDDTIRNDDSTDSVSKAQLENLVALGGCLCFYPESVTDTCDDMFVGMMEEKNGKECWTRITFNDEFGSFFRPICLLERKQLVLEMDDELKMYDFEQETFKDIVVDGIPDDYGIGGSFMETLISPHCTSQVVRSTP
ncbi:F-box/kelch-repeat protein At3g06240 [Spinacia oleracea]|uniref:F-box/kelch-repeat protein At3g06240 n=1 Tax=Spinacia oleracea TaxID=3562 RepID=A0A9R0I0X6_SPIOL|nr:F-box/kelch-repeat protein At3g06240-like [Spinacia oleracea]